MDYISHHYHMMTENPFESLDGVTVLLVEPEPENRSFYSQQLSGVNMKVISCDTLAAMQIQAQTNNPDVVIVNPSADINSGISMVRALKQEFPSLPVVTMSLTMREDHLDAIMQSGVDLHINRGLTRPRDLLLALEQVLAISNTK
jgi:CheY-like chemotaxis protein